MPLETATTIAELNASWPLGSDPKSQGDDHLRMIKGVMQNDIVPKSTGGEFAAGVKVIADAADDVPLTLEGAAAQTADLQIWQDSTGTELARIDVLGEFRSTVAAASGIVDFTNAPLTRGSEILATGSINGNSTGAKYKIGNTDVANGFSGFANFQATNGAPPATPTVVVRRGLNQTGDLFLAQNQAGDQIAAIEADGTLLTNAGQIKMRNTGKGEIYFGRAGGPNYLVADAAGTSFIIRGGDPLENWATINSVAGWTAGSDANLKSSITDISYGLATVIAIKAREFNWKSDGRHDIGFIAQEVEAHIPEVVGEMADEVFDATGAVTGQNTPIKTLRKDAMIAVLWRAVQELNAKVDALEAAPV